MPSPSRTAPLIPPVLLLLLLLLLLLPSHSPAVSALLLTGHLCDPTTVCEPPRLCVQTSLTAVLPSPSPAIPCNPTSPSCRCHILPSQVCDSNSDCAISEACVNLASTSSTSIRTCISCAVLRRLPHLPTSPVIGCPSPRPSLPPPPPPSSTPSSSRGLTLSPCTQPSDCLAPRICRPFNIPLAQTCTSIAVSQGLCLCFRKQHLLCLYSTQCPRGEVCAIDNHTTHSNPQNPAICVDQVVAVPPRWTILARPGFTPPFSISPTPTRRAFPAPPAPRPPAPSSPAVTPDELLGTPEPSPSPRGGNADPGVDISTSPEAEPSTATMSDIGAIPSSSSSSETDSCIAMIHLSKLARKDLVFVHDRMADVLCDWNETCATDGHIVVVNDVILTMRAYCASTELPCVRRRMPVNSPRMRRGVRVKANTDGVVLTALAARFGWRAEEMVVRALVWVGF